MQIIFVGPVYRLRYAGHFFFGSVYAQQVKFGVPLRYAGHFVGSV